MTYNEYQNLAVRTCKVYDDNNMNLLHMAVGLHSEYTELGDAILKEDKINIGEEIADHMWYLAVYCHFAAIPFDVVVFWDEVPCTDHLSMLTSKFVDVVKKKAIYGNREPKVWDLERKLITNIISKLFTIAYAFDLDMPKLLENNIEKLKVRFPEKYTDLSANNRNLDAEYEQLKK
mgnify:FL=1